MSRPALLFLIYVCSCKHRDVKELIHIASSLMGQLERNQGGVHPGQMSLLHAWKYDRLCKADTDLFVAAEMMVLEHSVLSALPGGVQGEMSPMSKSAT